MARFVKPLDFNVVYHQSDGASPVEGFVKFIVEDVLEQEQGEFGFMRGYYAERDLLPGQSLFDTPFRIIEQSTFTILVVCRAFLRSDWSMYWSQVYKAQQEAI